MFKVTIDTNKKRLEIFAEGFFTDETMDNFIKESQRVLKKNGAMIILIVCIY